MFRRNKKENKAKLEHKLYLARENPEPVFDLSECGISSVPPGIYSLCRVFLKESLNLSHNCLTSLSGGGCIKDLHLLKILNIAYNDLKDLPDEINMLKSLMELYINNNHLKKLPPSLSDLSNLKILDISHNNLRYLPDNFGNLGNLTALNISANKDLNRLPKSICNAHRLTTVQLDSDFFLYPPKDIAQQGAEIIMKYICDDTGYKYVPPCDIVDSSNVSNAQPSVTIDEQFQEQKLHEFIEIERNNELLQKQEIELAHAQKTNRKKLLEDITRQQNKLDTQLVKLLQVKDMERFQLIEQLQSIEDNTEKAVNQLIKINNDSWSQLLTHEKEEEEKLLAAATKYNENLRKDDILAAMQVLLEQEANKFREFNENRNATAKGALEQEILSEAKIAEILKLKDLEQFELVSQLQKDSDLQKYVVATLLERGDARSWGLMQQVRLVESQLAALTTIEMDRRKLQLNEHINNLAEKRLYLSNILMDLLDQQNTRRAQLLSTLQTLEDLNDDPEHFWLRQYQQLLDRLPSGLSEAQKNIDPQLAEILLMAGVIHCLPFIAKWAQTEYNLENVTEEDLQEAGISKVDDRLKVIDAFRLYLSTGYFKNATAPPLLDEASAPPINTNNSYMTSECVVCLDLNCQVIFMPCGHYCTCDNCSVPLSDCPLCRGEIEQKVRVIC